MCFYQYLLGLLFLESVGIFGSSHQHILIWQNIQLSQLLCSLIMLGNFAFGGNRGKFSKWQLGHGCLVLLFSNSAISQLTPPNVLGNCPSVAATFPVFTLAVASKWLLGSCPRAWAVAPVDTWDYLGNCPYIMHGTSSYWCYSSPPTLAVGVGSLRSDGLIHPV